MAKWIGAFATKEAMGKLSFKVKDNEGLCHGIKLAEGKEQPGS